MEREPQFPPKTYRVAAWLLSVLLLVLAAQTGWGQDTPDFFRQNCMNCHTIGGGRLTGPDLKDALQRKDRAWLANFIMDPKSVIDSGDPYARQLFEQSRNVPMPTLAGMTRERAEKLLDLIEAESQLDESQFKGLQISTKPFTESDRQLGQEIFFGRRRLEAGGAACISCHSTVGIPALGGGHLGPDLTNVYERLKGRNALSAWLVAPGTETMQPIFKRHPMTSDEIHALVALFASTAAESPAEPTASRVALLFLGLLGATALVFGFDAIWKRRFQSVRKALVESTWIRGKR